MIGSGRQQVPEAIIPKEREEMIAPIAASPGLTILTNPRAALSLRGFWQAGAPEAL